MGLQPPETDDVPHPPLGKLPAPVRRGRSGATRSLADLVPGLADLWHQTRGDPRITIALLDGPVDPRTPALAGARLARDVAAESRPAQPGPALRHGTRVASLIFGQPGSGAGGIAPDCRGLVLPI